MIHRIATLTSEGTTTCRAIPMTTPSRTIIDLAAMLDGRPLEQALDRAEQLRLVDFAELQQRIADRPGRPGSPSLQAVLSRYAAGSTVTRSEMEERFLALCDDHRIPRPQVNIRIEGEEVDFVWRGERLIVEVDGFAFHSTRAAFERDRLRDQALQAAGWRVMRITWRQVADTPEAVVARIAAALAFSPQPAPRPSSARARTVALGRR